MNDLKMYKYGDCETRLQNFYGNTRTWKDWQNIERQAVAWGFCHNEIMEYEERMRNSHRT